MENPYKVAFQSLKHQLLFFNIFFLHVITNVSLFMQCKALKGKLYQIQAHTWLCLAQFSFQ